MKRLNHLYYENLSYSILKKEYQEVKNNCRHGRKLVNFANFLNSNIYEILKDLYNQKYAFDNYYIFLLKEYKYRIIMSETIRDKVVNHWVASYILAPSLEKSLIDSNVATRKNMGSSKAYQLFESYIKKINPKNKIFVLKLDMSKYFYNIDHQTLKRIIRKKIKDKDALNIIDKIIDETDASYVNEQIKFLKENEIKKIKTKKITELQKQKLIEEINRIPYYEKGKGLAIGNICSQVFAVFFLNEVDHFFKEILKCKYYVRYMDDIVVLDRNRENLQAILNQISIKLNDYCLKLNTKSNIFILNNGFTFLGYTYKIKYKLCKKPRNITFHKIRKKLKYTKKQDYDHYFRSIISYKGYLGNKYFDINDEFNYLSENNLVFLFKNDRYNFLPKYSLFIGNYVLSKYIVNNSISKYSFKMIKQKLIKQKINFILLKENKMERY